MKLFRQLVTVAVLGWMVVGLQIWLKVPAYAAVPFGLAAGWFGVWLGGILYEVDEWYVRHS